MVQHGVTIDETTGLDLFFERDIRGDQTTVIGGQRAGKEATFFQTWATATNGDRTALVDGSEFLRITLQVSSRNGEVSVDPDVDAARENLAGVATTHYNEGFFVLHANRIDELALIGSA